MCCKVGGKKRGGGINFFWLYYCVDEQIRNAEIGKCRSGVPCSVDSIFGGHVKAV